MLIVNDRRGRAERRDNKRKNYGRFKEKDLTALKLKKEEKRKARLLRLEIEEKGIMKMTFDDDLTKEVNRLRILLRDDITIEGKTLKSSLAQLFVLYSENKIKYQQELFECIERINKYLLEE